MAEEKERRQLLDDHKESLQRVKEKSADDRKRAEMKFSQMFLKFLLMAFQNFVFQFAFQLIRPSFLFGQFFSTS